MSSARTMLILFSCTSIGCTGLTTPELSRTVAPELRVGAMNDRTRFESDSDFESSSDGAQRARTGAFATGIALGAIGLAGIITFATLGEVSERQLAEGFEGGGISRERAETVSDRGALANNLAITSAAVGLAGLVTAAVAFGIDFTACGRLARRRKECRERDRK